MFDDSGSIITDYMAGRTVDHVIRNGLDLEVVFTDGHIVVLASDVNYNIQYKKQSVKVMLKIPNDSLIASAGKL